MSPQENKPLHIAMYPWFAMGHLTSYLHLANKLAQRGHIISFLLPTKTQLKLNSLNHHPNFLTFYPITIPPVDGLPAGAETTNDVLPSARTKIMAARDLTRDQIDSYMAQLKPDFLFFDSPEWVPQVALKHGAKPIYYAIFYVAMFAYCNFQARNLPLNHRITEADLIQPPPGFPSSSIRLHAHEARALARVFSSDFGNGKTFLEKQDLGIQDCVGIGFRSGREMDGVYADFLEKHLGKPVLLAGFVVPDPPTAKLDEYFDSWLNGFGHGTVVYCALGSEGFLNKEQFDELVLGLELTGKPFLAAIKPPEGYETIESALPEGFAERTKGKGIVYGGWVQQPLIVQHPSVGCFVTHCGTGSLSEALMGGCQLVLMPQGLDQYINARVMSVDMKVGVEVEKGEDDGFISREAICKAVELVMDEEGEVGKEVRANNAKWRELLFKQGLEESYINDFVMSLRELL
ncbi:cyanidin 3-O-galactoside 2''-O-xylosyltransferase FGGT1-like [Silene latifolia]|uniref:cyanidin 3-O-galactoside 2''-O-xylosyltransferase FGGT1-like n=1 Tax=Silene latifolia TaxID=37657 RepID=UPI003D775151